VEAFREAVLEGRGYLRRNDDASALRAFHRALEAWSGEPLAEDFYADWAQPPSGRPADPVSGRRVLGSPAHGMRS
jgi:hypothetical protein